MTGASPGNRNDSKYILSASSIRVSSNVNDLKFNEDLQFKLANDNSLNKTTFSSNLPYRVVAGAKCYNWWT